jgi:hypothetical protein
MMLLLILFKLVFLKVNIIVMYRMLLHVCMCMYVCVRLCVLVSCEGDISNVYE